MLEILLFHAISSFLTVLDLRKNFDLHDFDIDKFIQSLCERLFVVKQIS